jgi:two-component system NtrC family sensor kinase
MTTHPRPRVLCVDDEPHVLAGLEQVLRRRFDVTTAAGGREGLRSLAQAGPFTIVVSDFRMPEMNGAEFLRHVRDVAPDTIRILLTGQASLEDAISAVNEGYIFRFLSKPCPTPMLLKALDGAVEQARLVTRDRELLESKLEAMSGHLLRAERLATLGTLAGAVGHELANMLVAFDSALRYISKRSQGGLAPEEEDLTTLGRVREHLATHAKHLLHLGRPGAPDGEPTDLCAVASDTLSMLRSAGTLRHVEVRLDLPQAPMPVRMDRIRLEQILLNLVKNAVDAMEGLAGRSPSLCVTIAPGEAPGAVSCRIEDNGCGIPQGKLLEIFEPYYTTKPPERGTGLGLFVVKQILDASHGELSVTSSEGTGTTFTFRVPLARDVSPGAVTFGEAGGGESFHPTPARQLAPKRA